MIELIDASRHLDAHRAFILVVALLIAFGFEVINGFHDTANAVTTVIYTRTLRPTLAVIFSGVCNFLGVVLGGTAIAFSIVHLLPVDLLIDATSKSAMIMVLALLTSGMAWNLSTWWLGLPVSSSHTLIGAILGIGMAHGLLSGRGLAGGVNWEKAGEVGLTLSISPLVGFVSAAMLLLAARRSIRDPELYAPPEDPGARPPWWIRAILVTTCGGVSLAHGSNDGQKGMGLIMLVLIGLLPASYALNLKEASGAREARAAASRLRLSLASYKTPDASRAVRELDALINQLEGKDSLREVPLSDRWHIRAEIFHVDRLLGAKDHAAARSDLADLEHPRRVLRQAIEYVPTWVVIGVALCLGIGTTVGYERIVITVAEQIGESHLTYAQGACAELVAMTTIAAADLGGLPVSTTHVLSSGVAGTMWANRSGLRPTTLRQIVLAWILTLPASMLISAGLFLFGSFALGS